MKKKVISILLSVIFFVGANAQDDIDKLRFGVRYKSAYDYETKRYYNFKVLHNNISIVLKKKNHDFYIGFQYSYIFQPMPIANKVYNKKSCGLDLGYRYYFDINNKSLKLFTQFNYSFFRVKYIGYQQGDRDNVHYINKVIPENTVSLGLEYGFNSRLHIFAGAGFGSYDRFFLMIDNFNLTNYFGIEYIF